jgi:hypothetical protein
VRTVPEEVGCHCGRYGNEVLGERKKSAREKI